jgi:hypothetical protein
MPAQATDSTPSPELLELLGLFSALEELGVDVDQQIDSRDAPEPVPPIETPPASNVSESESES